MSSSSASALMPHVKAVLEEQQRPRMTLGQQPIKLLDVLQVGEIRVHPDLQCIRLCSAVSFPELP